MPLVKELSDSPQWFTDLLLESFSKVTEKKNRFRSSRIFLTKDIGPSGESLFGYGFLREDERLIFIGRRHSSDKGTPITEHLKYIMDFRYGNEEA